MARRWVRSCIPVVIAVVVVAAGCTGSTGTQPSPIGTVGIDGGAADRTLAADLQRALDQARVEQRFPGVSAAVVLPDGSLWAGGSGYADIQSRRPVTPHTIFAIASMSKAFVSVLAVALAAHGVL